MLLRVIIVVVMGLQLLACNTIAVESEHKGYPNARSVTAAEFHELLSTTNGQVIDVRTMEEIRSGYIPNSIHINFYSITFRKQLAELDKNTPIFVYCAIGGRSARSMEILESMRFMEIYNLSGGFPAWKAAGYKIID